MPLVLIKPDPRAREKPCIRCGYSLRRIPDSKFCPECGLAIWLSLSSNDGLDWSNPLWLRRLSIATLILAAAQIIGLIVYIFLYRLGPALSFLLSAYLLLYHIGLLILCTHEERYPDRLKPHRLAARIASAVGLLAGCAFLASAAGVPLRFWWYILHFATPLLVLASSICTFALLRPLAFRIPNSTLARISGYILLIPTLAILQVFPALYILLANFFWLLFYLPWLYFPTSLLLFLLFSRSFHRASKAAHQAWTSETAPNSPLL